MTLKIGDSGSKVKELQELLLSQGILCEVDGVFGRGTQRAVREFQTRELLEPDAVVGDLTWDALNGPKNHEKPLEIAKFEFGKAYLPKQFEDYIKKITWSNWKPSLIVIHHTAAPSLAQ